MKRFHQFPRVWLTTTLACIGLPAWLIPAQVCFASDRPEDPRRAEPRVFHAKGEVRGLPADGQAVVIAHEAIPNYMPAMTMPFRVRQPSELRGLHPGDLVSFRLLVTDSESWIDQVVKTGTRLPSEPDSARDGSGSKSQDKGQVSTDHSAEVKPAERRHPLLSYCFTNELGQPVRLADFRGQALAITFFFSRCPIPEFCPQLAKNFAAASRRLQSAPNTPTNWHFLSVSFDPQFDTPATLRAYGESYHYDPAHWSFLTGPEEKIKELARLSDVQFEREGAFFNHNFRTLIIDTRGHLQMVFPTSGDLAEAIVSEILKAAAVVNPAS